MKSGFSSAGYKKVGWGLPEIVAHTHPIADVIEVWLEPPFFNFWRTPQEKSELDNLKEVCQVRDMDISLHAPVIDLNLGSLNPAVRKTAREEIKKSLEWADELGAGVVTFHPGFYFNESQKNYELLIGELLLLDKLVSDFNCTLCVENMDHKNAYMRSVDSVLMVLEQLENIKLTVDLAHLLQGYVKPLPFLKKTVDYVAHAHISDFDQNIFPHMPLVKTNPVLTKLLGLLKKAGYDGYFIFEGFMNDPVAEAPIQAEVFSKMAKKAGY